MDNTENVLAQLKQLILVLQAAESAMEGTYVAKVAVIKDELIAEKDAQIATLSAENANLKTAVDPVAELQIPI